MMIGFVFAGIFAGFFAAVVALVSGLGVLAALAAYSLGGIACMLVGATLSHIAQMATPAVPAAMA